MKVEEHTAKSLENIKKKYPELYEKNKNNLEIMIFQLHKWFDDFDNKKTEEYDYTGINCMKHREQRHHVEGIEEARKIFGERYGNEFGKIIGEESGIHIWDDIGKYLGEIPSRSDYKQIGFWKNLRGW